MRLDLQLTTLTQPDHAQRYFLGCWFNMVHMFSLDSFRVRVMNCRSLLREVERALNHASATVEDKQAVLSETVLGLAEDPSMQAEPFKDIVNTLVPYLKNDKLAKAQLPKQEERMLYYFLAEIRPLLDTKYEVVLFDLLADTLLRDSAPWSKEKGDRISRLTGNLLSATLDRGLSLESLYSLYSEILVPRKPNSEYHFDRRLGLVRSILSNQAQTYNVTFPINWTHRPEALPNALGDLTISDTPPFALKKTSPRFAPTRLRKFATVNCIQASDKRAAGAAAFEQINNAVNLLRFEYEQSRIEVDEQFAIVRASSTGASGQLFRVPRLVPNPASTTKVDEAAAFVASVKELISGSKFTSEGRDRIHSAFRLYRQGRDHSAADTMLVNWWTALEYLVRGSSTGSSIGKSVEDSLAPLMANCYVLKLLLAIRNILVVADVRIDDAQANTVDWKAIDPKAQLYMLRDTTIQAAILAQLTNEPYVCHQLSDIFASLASPATLHKRISEHQQRVRWQVERIWRTRCDIVHSAGRGSNLPLLCSNLEYYLKTALNEILQAIRSLATLSGPHEFFDREIFKYQRIMSGLHSNDESTLIASLVL